MLYSTNVIYVGAFASGGSTTCHTSAIHLRCFFTLFPVPALQARQMGRAPWSLTFSYGRALQHSVLKLWSADRTKARNGLFVSFLLIIALFCTVLHCSSP